jgi:hypothetical protein
LFRGLLIIPEILQKIVKNIVFSTVSISCGLLFAYGVYM